MTVGNTKTFTVRYPDDYGIKELAGSAVDYTVTIKSLKRRVVPELDDEFARDLGEFDTLAAREAVEVERALEAVPMEEVFLLVLGFDEAEAPIGNDALDGTGGHHDLLLFSNWLAGARSVREEATTRSFVARGGERSPYHATWTRRAKSEIEVGDR